MREVSACCASVRALVLVLVQVLFAELPSSRSYVRWVPFLLAPLEPLLGALSVGGGSSSGNASQLLLLLETLTRYGSSLT